MSKFTSIKFYRKWLKDLFNMFRFMPKKEELLLAPLAFLGLIHARFTFSKTHKALMFPRKRIIDAICVFVEIFVNQDYLLDEILEGTTIIDCGGNFGFATAYFKLKHPDNIFIVLEPDEENFSILKRNLDAVFPELDGILLKKAVSPDSEGVIIVDDKQASSLKQFFPDDKNESKKRIIPSISLNEIIEKYNVSEIGILKMDIEGAEKYLFENMNSLDKALKIAKYIIIETHDEFSPGIMRFVENCLLDNNYELKSRKFHEFAKTTIDVYKNKEY